MFKNGTIAVIEGNIEDFISKDKNNVAEVVRKKLVTLFGLIKPRDNSLSIIVDTLDSYTDSLKYNFDLKH